MSVQAFASGVAFHTASGLKHSPSDPYHVMEPLSQPLLSDDWSAEDENRLIAAIKVRGIANWLEVSEQVGNQSRDKCKNHYEKYYLNAATSPLPDVDREIKKTDPEVCTCATLH